MSTSTSFLELPGEIRNKIYSYIFRSDDMELVCTEDGHSTTRTRFAHALGATCNQIWRETRSLPKATVKHIIFKPHFETSSFGNKAIHYTFDLNHWVPYCNAHRLIAAITKATLCAGEIDPDKLRNAAAWELEMEGLISGIPPEGITMEGVDLFVNFTILAAPAPPMHLTIELENMTASEWRKSTTALHERALACTRTAVEGLTMREWQEMHWGDVAMRRGELSIKCLKATHEIGIHLGGLYERLDRQRAGQREQLLLEALRSREEDLLRLEQALKSRGVLRHNISR